MRRLLLTAVLMLTATVAQADEAQTRFGRLEVVDGAVFASFRTLQFDGRPVPGPDREAPELYHGRILGLWPVGAADIALIGYGREGSGPCMAQYLIVQATTSGATSTAPFGRCFGEVLAVRPTASGLDIDLQSINPRLDHVAITYSGGRATETDIPLPDTPVPVPGGGASVTRWAGVHPHTMIRDPGERQRFNEIMSKQKLFELMDRMYVGNGVALEAGWAIATGIMPHQGGVEAGGFAIEVATGRVEAVMFHACCEPEVFGGTLDTVRPVLQAVARTGRR